MKMENEIVAPSDGTVKAFGPAEGASVNTGDILIELG
jgi:biotin carboxyl carrier protein